MTNDLRIKKISIDQLISDPKNARTHDKKNIEAIKSSLTKFGQRKPIVVMGDGTVIAGNGTLEAAKQIGWTELVCALTPDDWTWDQARAYALADNRTAELADWDSMILADQLLELDSVGWDIKELGFGIDDMDEAKEVVQDEVPDDSPTRTKENEVWIMGSHRLMIGDSTKENDYQKLMAGKQADCILTDPPYNVNYQGGTKDKLTIQNDAMTDENFAQFLKDAYNRMFDSAKPGAAIYVFHSDTGGGIFRKALIESGFYLKQCLIWVKDTFVMSRQDYHWQHEPILYGWKPGAAHKWFGRRIRSTVLDDGKDPSTLSKAELVEIVAELQEMSTIQRADKPHKNDKHPTMKPVPLVAQLMSYSSEPDDIVLDPFCGSGTTLIAAEQLGRYCYAIEKDPRYADVIIDRWEKITGQHATKEN